MRIFFNKTAFILFFISLFSSFAEAKSTQFYVKAYLEGEKVFVNREAGLTVVVRTDKEVIRPYFPSMPYLQIEFEGASEPSPTFINGAVAWERYYVFSVIAERAGVFEIPSSTVTIGGEKVGTNPITIEVLKGGSYEKQEGESVFVTSEVSPVEAYINQEIIYTLKFYRRVNVENETLDSPVFEGFIVESIEPEIDYKDTIGEKDYYVHEKKLALFPLKTGKLIIPPSKIICDVPVEDKIFGDVSDISPYYTSGSLERKTFSSGVISVNVIKIPDEAKPENFKNLVGDYSIKSEISKPAVNMGQTTSLIITVSGKGNINDIAEPDSPELADFKVYKEFPIVKLYKDGNTFAGEKIFKRILFPLKSGERSIAPVSIVFFDPLKRKYIKAQSEALQVNIINSGGSDDTESVTDKKVVFKQNVRQVAEDILPIKLSLDNLKNSPSLPELNLIIGLFSAPPLAFLFLLFVSLKKIKEDEDTDKYRRTKAMKSFSVDFKKIKNNSGNNGRQLCEILLSIVKIYFGNKLGIKGEALTVKDIKEILDKKRMNADDEKEFIRCLQKTEFLAFSDQKVSQEQVKSTAERVYALIKIIDKIL